MMCRVLEVSTSGYYAWRKQPDSHRKKENVKLAAHIKAIYEESKQTYGSPRVYLELSDRGIRCGKNRVARLMRESGIQAKHKKKHKVTTDSDHQLPVHENKLRRCFTVEAPNTVWAADLTYIWTREGWLYLAVLMDLFSRKIIGWSLQETMATQLVIDALKMGLRQRYPRGEILHHSDRGSQYASKDYQKLLKENGIVCSTNRKGDCWYNAVVESFFSTFKREWVQGKRYLSRAEARADIFHFIEIWYNRKQRHSTLGYLSPAEFEVRAARDA